MKTFFATLTRPFVSTFNFVVRHTIAGTAALAGNYFGARYFSEARTGILILGAMLIGAGNGRWLYADMLVSDFNNQKVLRFTNAGMLLGTFGDASQAGSGLISPQAIAVDSSRRVYVASSGTNQILRYSPSGSFLGVFATLLDQGPINGLDFDSQGNLYTRQGGSFGTIIRMSPSGAILNSFSTGRFWSGDIALDGSGTLYVPRENPPFPDDNPALEGIFKYTATGGELGYFGQATRPISGLTAPQSSLFDSAGNLLVLGGRGIERYSSSGTYLGVFATGGGPARNLALDGLGNFFATDGSEDAVLKYSSQGTFLGKLVNAGQGGLPASFRPEGIAFITVPEPSAFVLGAYGALGLWMLKRAQLRVK